MGNEATLENAQGGGRMRMLMLAALGVVYGDIGTSPLYALRECFHGPHAIAVDTINIFGVLSLTTWSLVVVISIKYLLVIMRADNHGEGGILALMALVCPPRREGRLGHAPLVLLGLFGAALLYGDGVITPAISVLSAAEGLQVATPALQAYVLPVTIVILMLLFFVQRHGTAKVGAFFGPVTLVWFTCIAVLGAVSIARTPQVLQAINPAHAVAFFAHHGWHGVLVLGVVFLVVTGGEALYADMGHFGATPIRRVWFLVVLPALLINYLGQGALLLRAPELAENPFFHLAPRWGLYPLVALAAAATVIASQAVITGAFSLTSQAVHLGYLPRFEVQHTSTEEIGQVYIPKLNQALLVATIGLVLVFRTSSNLAAAYGIAVTATMAITSILAFVAMRRVWRWSLPLAIAVTGIFLAIDLAFLGANLVKVKDGGWFPLVLGIAVALLMTTWSTGVALLTTRLRERAMSLDDLGRHLRDKSCLRTSRTAVFLTRTPGLVAPALLRILRHLNVVPERAVFCTTLTERVPHVAETGRYEVTALADGFHRVLVHYGFMESPNIPRVVEHLRRQGLDIDPNQVVYIISRETLLATKRPGMAIWRERLFGWMAQNAGRATEFYRIPPAQVLEVGAQIEL